MAATQNALAAASEHQLPWKRSLSIAITGMGLVTPLGIGCEENVRNLLEGRPGFRLCELPNVETLAPTWAARAPEVSIAERLRIPKNQKYMNRPVQLALSAALDAYQASGVARAGLNPERFGVYTGSGQTGLEFADFHRSLEYAWGSGEEMDYKLLGGRAAKLIDPYFSLRTLSNAGTALISAEVGARGPSSNFVQSEAASASAIAAGCYDLIEDRCDAVIVGGFDSLLQPGAAHAFDQLGLLAGPDLQNPVRPFDAHGQGLVLGEGAAFFVLERKQDALRRGVPILGEIVAVETAAAPERRQGQAALEMAITQATEDVEEIGFVVARGLGAPDYDRSELQCLKKLMQRGTPITAFKSLTGYLGAATAAAELALGLLAMRSGTLPAIHGLTDPMMPDLEFVRGQGRTLPHRVLAGLFVAISWAGPVSAIVAGAEPESV